MANKTLDDLAAQVAANETVEASAITLINGFANRVQKAVDEALAGGATKEQLAPVQAEVDSLKLSGDALANAITANTPAAPAVSEGEEPEPPPPAPGSTEGPGK